MPVRVRPPRAWTGLGAGLARNPETGWNGRRHAIFGNTMWRWCTHPAYAPIMTAHMRGAVAQRNRAPDVLGRKVAEFESRQPTNRPRSGRLARPAGSCHPSARLSASQGRRQSRGMVPTDSRYSVVGEPVVPIADPPECGNSSLGRRATTGGPCPIPPPMLVLRQGRYGGVGCDA